MRSHDIPATFVSPDTAPAYLQRFVGEALRRRGFDGAEAGALAEIERLLEHRESCVLCYVKHSQLTTDIQRLFEHASEYAQHAGRRTPHARDLVRAQEDSGWDVATLRRAAKRKRPGVALRTEEEPPEPPTQETLATLPDGEDVKPTLRKAPEYAWEGAPGLPEPWTYMTDPVPPPVPPASKVTTGVLDFIKLTATERGDIPPELGLVDYRRVDGRETRRRWGVKGVGAA